MMENARKKSTTRSRSGGVMRARSEKVLGFAAI
jgi:hypothetical protein